MQKITDIKITPLGESKFVRPYAITYKEEGVAKKWDCVEAHDSVSAVLYHRQKEAFLFVKQFRPSVWAYQHKSGQKHENMGYTHELCAGLMDKGLDEKSTIIEEILEETGYAVNEVHKIAATYSALGFAANRQTLFWAVIDEGMKVGPGGGVDGENIELVFVKKEDVGRFLFDEQVIKAANLMFGVSWVLGRI